MMYSNLSVHVHDGLQAAALDVLRGMASLLLSTFPTTVEEDRQQLAASSDADLQLALRFRIEKKRVLLNAIDAISHKRKVRSSESCRPTHALFRPVACRASTKEYVCDLLHVLRPSA